MKDAGADLGRWEPLSVREVAALLDGVEARWWIAGGQAIDAFVGRRTRSHGDVDVGPRRDQRAMRAHLVAAGLDPYPADPPGSLRPWPQTPWSEGEDLPPHVHDIWVRRAAGGPWCLQLMLDETEGAPGSPDTEEWVYRRDPRVRRPLATLIWRDAEGIPYLAPEVQLLYKAPGHLVAKNSTDFAVTLPHLAREARQWLRAALATAHPEHRWLRDLGGPPRG